MELIVVGSEKEEKHKSGYPENGIMLNTKLDWGYTGGTFASTNLVANPHDELGYVIHGVTLTVGYYDGGKKDKYGSQIHDENYIQLVESCTNLTEAKAVCLNHYITKQIHDLHIKTHSRLHDPLIKTEFKETS